MKNTNKIRLIVLLSGFISMELEILGTRLISPIFGSTIYVWTSLIGVTLTFLALGYWYGGKLADKGKINLNKLGLIIFLLGVYVCLLPFISRAVLYQVNSLGMILGPLSISFVILAFPIFFLGFIVPTSVKLVTSSLGEVGRKAGEIYALATVGSIIGTFTTGFFLILYLGVIKTALITGIILILFSLIIIKSKIKFLLIFAIPLLLIFQSQFVYPSEILESFEGHNGQVRVIKENNVHMRLYNGALASTSVNLKTKENEMGYAKYFEIPFIYKPEHKKTLMVGLAGGAAARELVEKYNLEMDVVEIEPKMLDLARKYFYWDDEATVYFDDGRHFIQNSDEKYDVIMIDIGLIFPAWHLYTKEAFQKYEKHLNDDGMLVINLISAKEGKYSKTSKSLYKTLELVFKDVLILRHPRINPNGIQNIILLASKNNIYKNKFVSTIKLSNYSGPSIEEIIEDNSNFEIEDNVRLTTDNFPIAEFYDYENRMNFELTKKRLKYFLP
ncbi:MAG: fused MFS/spermidine synthase [Nanoarchaeota archaeon]